VHIGNDAIVFGYPVSLGLHDVKHPEQDQLDPLFPLIRKGAIAGKNYGRRLIVLDAPSYFGNSGGPAVEVDRAGFAYKLNIIGVITDFVPFVDKGQLSITYTNSGYSIAVPMDPVLELVK
jgi:hypothetical protein